MTAAETWARQPGESTAAFAAFAAYRDLGPLRSQAKVSAELGKSLALLNRWSARHAWVLRAAAFDAEQDREWQLERRAAIREAARRNARIASAAMDLLAERLESLSADEIDVPGLARLMDAASKLERLALGQSTESVELTGADGGPVKADVAVLTDEERLIRMATLRRELGRRLGADSAYITRPEFN